MLRLALAVCLFWGLFACGGTAEKQVETRILCVWDSGERSLLEDPEFARVSTRHMQQWRSSARSEAGRRFLLQPQSSTRSMSAAFANVLTGEPASVHGLRSVHELGAQALSSEVATLAEQLPESFVTLASVSQAHFGMLGLDRGVQQWFAPAVSERRETWDAGEVWEAVEGPLSRALASDEPVFLVLHFSDLRGEGWRKAVPSRDSLELGMRPWRGKGGEVDAAFDDTQSEFPLHERLAKRLLRRKGDPRCVALEEILREARLESLDSVLGRVVRLLEKHHRLDSASLELSTGANAAAEAVGGQALHMRGTGAFADMRSKLLVGSKAQSLGATGESSFEKRGQAFTLQLDHPQLFSLNPGDVFVGDVSLTASDLPLLLAQQSSPWPENALVGPMLDLQNAGGRRLSVSIDAAPGQSVELLLESFPSDSGWLGGYAAAGVKVEPHELRPGAYWIRGEGPMSFTLPPRTSTARLGLVLRIDGQRVGGSRMRYMKRVFAANDSLTLGFSAGSWLQAPFRNDADEQTAAPIRIRLTDELPLRASMVLPTPSQLSYLLRLDEDE